MFNESLASALQRLHDSANDTTDKLLETIAKGEAYRLARGNTGVSNTAVPAAKSEHADVKVEMAVGVAHVAVKNEQASLANHTYIPDVAAKLEQVKPEATMNELLVHSGELALCGNENTWDVNLAITPTEIESSDDEHPHVKRKRHMDCRFHWLIGRRPCNGCGYGYRLVASYERWKRRNTSRSLTMRRTVTGL